MYYRLLLGFSLVAFFGSHVLAEPLRQDDVRHQNKVFQKLWGTDFSWKFDDLPLKAGVPKYRVPYSGYIYPDTEGGCDAVLRKYDVAFHDGRLLSTMYEMKDIEDHKVRPESGFRRFRRFGRLETPYWAGHCNGWTAAAIRHAEPQRSVIRNGVVFNAADIKGLMAELYVYSQAEMLAGAFKDQPINAGLLHAILGNWIGRGEHPLGMDKDPSKEIWNFPIYAYTGTAVRRGRGVVEIKMNVGFVNLAVKEQIRSPRNLQHIHLHYAVELDAHGQIVGGHFFNDSHRVDLVWVPLEPKQGGKEGNVQGNPYLSADEVLSMWRESCSEKLRSKWWNVDPTNADRVGAAGPFGWALRDDGGERSEARAAVRMLLGAESGSSGRETDEDQAAEVVLSDPAPSAGEAAVVGGSPVTGSPVAGSPVGTTSTADAVAPVAESEANAASSATEQLRGIFSQFLGQRRGEVRR